MNISNLHQSTRIILNLMNIAEEMLFSINLKPEIVKKYESMRETVFEKLGLSNDFYKYWELQSKAKEFADNKKNMQDRERKIIKSNLEEANGNLSKSLITFNHLLNNLKSNLEEAGNMNQNEGKKVQISLDISSYPSELNKFESEISGFLKRFLVSEKELFKSKEKIDSLMLENQSLLSHINELNNKHQESLENLENNYKGMLLQITSHNMNDSKKITDLEMSFQEKETQLMGQLDKLTNEDASVLKHLREKLEKLQSKNQDLRNILKAAAERSSIIFNEFVDKGEISEHLAQRKNEIIENNDSKSWNYYSDMLVEIDFIGYSLHKLKGDNDWLVEQLDCFCRENEELKQRLCIEPKKSKMKSAFTSLSSNDIVVKDFNEARKKLLSQFKDMNPNYD